MNQLFVRGFVILAIIVALGACGAGTALDSRSEPRVRAPERHRIILFVWDGMRPDSISQTDTPNLATLAQRGTYFADNHASYPTLTMMNAAAFATGAFSGRSGFFGNSLWQPGAPAYSSSGQSVDLNDPVFTEDYGILKQLDTNQDGHLVLIGTLFQAAQRAGLKTAAVGKSGPAFMQDYKNGGVMIDEKVAFPLEFARALQSARIALPATSPLAYPKGALKLADDNGDPTFQPPLVRMADGVTPDPADASGAPPTRSNEYLMSVFLDYVLPSVQPDLSVVWLRNPDTTEHAYGVGSANYHAALKAQDKLLGKLQDRLVELGVDAATDLIIVSDHGHSNVSGPLDLFPPRKVENGRVGEIDREHGYSVSGNIRLADELGKAGIRAYDGGGCMYDPVLSGIGADSKPLHPDQHDAAGSRCAHTGNYTTPSYVLPHPSLPRGSFVVVANGGSDYIYHPEHDPEQVRAVVRFLQSHEEFGAIFVAQRYGEIPGTLPLSIVHLENVEGRNPDIVVGYTFDDQAMIRGMPGIEFEGISANVNRGQHGSFSPVDVHNTLAAIGPDFRAGFTDGLPSGNVDVAPTIATILGFGLPQADGRPLLEALNVPAHIDAALYTVTQRTVAPRIPAQGLSIKSPTGKDTGKTGYNFQLHVKDITYHANSYIYFDWARAERQ